MERTPEKVCNGAMLRRDLRGSDAPERQTVTLCRCAALASSRRAALRQDANVQQVDLIGALADVRRVSFLVSDREAGSRSPGEPVLGLPGVLGERRAEYLATPKVKRLRVTRS